MKKNFIIHGLALIFMLFVISCKSSNPEDTTGVVKDGTKIISLNGTITEILTVLGHDDQIVGIDITSTYPGNLKASQLGHISQIKAEGIIALNPDVILAKKEEFDEALKTQLEETGIKIVLLEHEYSVKGAVNLITSVAEIVDETEKVSELQQNIEEKISQTQPLQNPPSVLFVYARGAGNMMVAGDDTQMQAMITLAGGKNAVSGFNSFKPLSPEILIEANPDAILLFESGKRSLNGVEGLLEIPGMKETNAGKNKNFISMDGLYLSGFGPRLGDAVLELHQSFAKINN